MMPEPYRHLNWVLRLTTSRKLSSLIYLGVEKFHSYYFCYKEIIRWQQKQQKKRRFERKFLVQLMFMQKNLLAKFFCMYMGMNIKGLSTVTLMYKIGVTNLEFTLGVTENIDAHGKIVDTLYLPRTLRVKDHSIERSSDGEVVDFIFMREATTNIYKTLTFADPNKKIPMIIKDIIDPSFFR